MRFVPRAPSAPPEDSVAIRFVVAIAVEVGVLAIVLQGVVDPATAVAALVLAPLGYLVSYRRRAAKGVAIKVALSFALLVALARFIAAVGGVSTVDQARAPLAALFLWVQVLHAFDVPRRRDLAFSMVSSVTLVAVGGALSLTTAYLGVLLPWTALAAAWLWLSARPRPDEVAHPVSVRRIDEGRRSRAAGVRSAALAGVVAVVVGALVFLSMPRLPASLVRTPPFSLGDRGASPADAEGIENPGLPSAGTDGVVDFAPEGYPGFSSAMDLRARGRLSEDIAFRVRADQPALWRAEVFDTYDGAVWTSSATAEDERPVPTSFEDDGYEVPLSDLEAELPPAFSRRVVQTFYLSSVQPNVLFAAARAERVYFPSGGLRIDPHGAISSPILLDDGLVYSVVSEVPSIPAELMRRLPAPDPRAEPLARYLQLPEAMPARVERLAEGIVAETAAQIDAVAAVEAWLRANTVYDLGVAREPEGVDAVDHFLFETRRGFCEHIASAMAVLLRSVEIPTRIVVGFGPGERNPFTGYWEVRQSDAHAWVEVWYPQAGWLPYDPTFGVPAAEPSLASRFPITEAVAALGAFVRERTPAAVKAAVGYAAAAIGSGVRAALVVWPAALGGLVAGALAIVLARLRGRRRVRGPTDAAGLAYEELVAALTASGRERGAAETPRELLAVARSTWTDEELLGAAEVVVATFERSRWERPRERPGGAETGRASEAAATLRRSSASR